MKNIEVVNASAGTGKTYNLTHRTLDEVKSGIPADMVFAATFTRKAAAELSARLRQLLISDGDDRAADLLADGFVGTVNGTCSRLLTEYAIDAGLSPAVDVIPEENAEGLFLRAVAGAIETHMARIEPAASRLSRTGGGSGAYGQHPDWRKDVKKAAELARINAIAPDTLRACGSASWRSYSDMLGDAFSSVDAQALFQEAKKAIAVLEALPTPTGVTQKVLDSLRDFIRKDGSDLSWTEWGRLAKLKPGKDGLAAIKDIQDMAKQWLRNPLLHSDLKTIITGVFSCAADALEHYQDYKKRHGLMDFVDQEVETLHLLKSNAAFRALMKERLSLLMVDEFQDTSPMQLSLFLELHDLVGKSVWVGDPKQAIYGFRGTDPALMNDVVAQVETTSTLEFSWRSKETLVAFVNAIFKRVFFDTPEERVRLLIPEKRRADAKGGTIETWLLDGGNVDDAAHCLAVGVAEFLKRNSGIRPADVAILCRTNEHCEKVATALNAVGIRASTAQGLLAETPVCRLALAALRYLLDSRDTLAMAELVKLTPGHPTAETWLQDLVVDHDAAYAGWRESAPFQALDAARPAMRYWTPLEALEFAIGASNAAQAAKVWANTSLSLANLDKLRLVCVQYLDQCRARRTAAGVAGLLTFLAETRPGETEGTDDETVRVLSYHKSKGLEWPVVVLYNLDAERKASAFGMWAETEGNFDPQHPLAGRTIHFWPDPIPGRSKSDDLDALVRERPEHAQAIQRDAAERQRLLYVGMTRARDTLILGVRKKVTKSETSLMTAWLDELSDESGAPLLAFPKENSDNRAEQTHSINIGTDVVDITVREYPGDVLFEPTVSIEASAYLAPSIPQVERLPARLVPSQLEADEQMKDAVQVSLFADFHIRAAVEGKPDFGRLGDAVHGFFGMDKRGLRNAMLLEAAGDVLQRFGVDGAVSVTDLVAMQERLGDFIKNRYPECIIRHEWPISWKNSQNQLLQGWIDLLLETPDGYVIIDHKSYPGDSVTERIRNYAPQLAAYRRAVEAATGKTVVALLVHLPILGQVYELTGLNENGSEAWI